MAGEELRLRVVTPDGGAFDERVLSVTARSEVGELCVLPRHRPILAALRAGRLVAERAGGEPEVFVTDSGFLEGGPDHVNVIARRCEAAAELDADEMGSEVERLERRLAELEEDDPDRERAAEDLAWARVRLDVARR